MGKCTDERERRERAMGQIVDALLAPRLELQQRGLLNATISKKEVHCSVRGHYQLVVARSTWTLDTSPLKSVSFALNLTQ